MLDVLLFAVDALVDTLGYVVIYDLDSALVKNFIFERFMSTIDMLLRFIGSFWVWNMCNYADSAVSLLDDILHLLNNNFIILSIIN